MIKCVKIRRPDSHGNQWCLSRLESFSATDEFDGAEVGERIELEYVEMSETDFEKVPEVHGMVRRTDEGWRTWNARVDLVVVLACLTWIWWAGR